MHSEKSIKPDQLPRSRSTNLDRYNPALTSKRKLRKNCNLFKKFKSQEFIPIRVDQIQNYTFYNKDVPLVDFSDTTDMSNNGVLLDIPPASANQGRLPSPNLPKKEKGLFVRNLKASLDEQCTKLAQKFSFDLEMMEDLKSFSKHKAALDKDYSQKLTSLVSQFSQKLPGGRDIPDSEDRSILDIWKIILEACQSMAEGMGKMAEVLSTEVCNVIRSKKRTRETAFKKGQEQAQQMAGELLGSAKELSKIHHHYTESEKEACEVRQKFNLVEAKQRGGKTSLFETHSHLEKNFSKTKRKVLTTEHKATDARNEYLMLIDAFNSHASQYQLTYLRQLQREHIETNFREMRDYLITVGRSCVETFDDLKSQFFNALAATHKTKAQLEMDSFLAKNPIFTTSLSQEFEPYSNDQVRLLSTEYGSYSVLNKAVQNLTLQVEQERDRIVQKTKAMQGLNSISDAYAKTPEFGTEEANVEADQKIEMLKREIRLSEIIILKSESKLTLLAALGLDVEKSRASAVDLVRSQTSTLTVTRDSKTLNTRNLAALTSNANQGPGHRNSMPDITPSLLVSHPSGISVGSSTSTETNLPRYNPSVSFLDAYSSEDETSEADFGSVVAIKKSARVLYSFQATTEEDISIVENEIVEIREEEDNGWCRGVNSKGEEGYFPSSYVQVLSRPSTPGSPSSSTSNPSLVTQSSTTSAQSHPLKVRSMCAYDAAADDELSFPEGVVIQIMSKEDEDWWTGSYDGKTGVFPVGAVNEIYDSASGLSNTSRDSSISESFS